MTPSKESFEAVNNMLAELEEYLLSPELFWPLSQRGSISGRDRLTLGNLMLSMDALYAERQEWNFKSETTYRKIEMRWGQSLEKWQSVIQRKAEAEMGSRVNVWQAYLEDLDDGQGARFDYAQEVRNRVIIERLFDLGVSREDWGKVIQNLDRKCRRLIVPFEFIWSVHLQEIYPQERYWFLFAKPRQDVIPES